MYSSLGSIPEDAKAYEKPGLTNLEQFRPWYSEIAMHATQDLDVVGDFSWWWWLYVFGVEQAAMMREWHT